MKKLYLLRHAQSQPSFDIADKDRTLTDHGKKEATSLGTYMSKNNIIPDQIICSTAIRTRKTLDSLKQSIKTDNINFSDSIYNASTGDILKEIQNTADDIKSLLIIGHNPAIHATGQLIAPNGDKEAIHKHTIAYPPNTLTIIDCPTDKWSDIQPSINIMTEYIETKDHYNT